MIPYHHATSTSWNVGHYLLRVTRFRLYGLPIVHEYSENNIRYHHPDIRHRWYVDQAELEHPGAWKHLGLVRNYPSLSHLLAHMDRDAE